MIRAKAPEMDDLCRLIIDNGYANLNTVHAFAYGMCRAILTDEQKQKLTNRVTSPREGKR